MITWERRESWIAVFDILGFKELIKDVDRVLPRALLINKIEELLGTLDSDAKRYGELEHMVISDTIILFSPDSRPQSYPWFLNQCKEFITESIYLRFPLRGAISCGVTYTAKEQTIILGQAFAEAFEYCEDQDWIGLILTPEAICSLKEAGLNPLHHDFRPITPDKKIMRKKLIEEVLAYRFQNGSCNFESPLLSCLEEMQQMAPEECKGKYDNTIDHIKRNYSWNRP